LYTELVVPSTYPIARYIKEIDGCIKVTFILNLFVQVHNPLHGTYKKLTAVLKWLVYWTCWSKYI